MRMVAPPAPRLREGRLREGRLCKEEQRFHSSSRPLPRSFYEAAIVNPFMSINIALACVHFAPPFKKRIARHLTFYFPWFSINVRYF